MRSVQILTGWQTTCWHSATAHCISPLLHRHLEQRPGFHASPSLYSTPCQEQDSDTHADKQQTSENGWQVMCCCVCLHTQRFTFPKEAVANCCSASSLLRDIIRVQLRLSALLRLLWALQSNEDLSSRLCRIDTNTPAAAYQTDTKYQACSVWICCLE